VIAAPRLFSQLLSERACAAELREAITAWLVKYHTRLAHQSLGWMTPSEYRAAHLSKPVAQAA
jgi:transposase InsO family protein